MYELSRAVPADDGQAGGPKLTRSEVWAGLLIGARDARPVGPLITHCEVVEEYEGGLVRTSPSPTSRCGNGSPSTRNTVRFDRLSGPEPGEIYNDIEYGEGGRLYLRFRFRLEAAVVLPGAEGRSAVPAA
ncbi:SRPBCC family protein [Streptomyces sp. NPDC059455]|uniref:SRPBCC family protein n=1 Tax=Streptomyces sp. NPDC059455 TaxID=3346837 RepID=UPI0036D15184